MSDTAPQTPDLNPSRPTARRWRRLRVIIALVMREMSTQYGKSPGGYIWAILEPLGAIIILSVGFSLVMRSPSLGNSFILFYATGYLPYDLFNKVSNRLMPALRQSKNLLAYPTVKWVDVLAGRFILVVLTMGLVAYLLLAGILIFQDTGSIVSYGPVLLAFLLAALLGAGAGMVNSVISGFLPVWISIWTIFTRPLFLASGILLIYENLPTVAQNILYFNPLMHITGLARTGFFPNYRPQYISIIYVLVWIFILLAFGLLLLRRYHREIVNR